MTSWLKDNWPFLALFLIGVVFYLLLSRMVMVLWDLSGLIDKLILGR